MFVRLPPVPGVEEVLFDLAESGPEVVVLGVVLCPGAVLTRLDPGLYLYRLNHLFSGQELSWVRSHMKL